MKEALRNLLLVTGAISICVFAVWGFLRFQGLTAVIKPPLDHPFLRTKDTDIVAYHVFPKGRVPAYQIDELKKLAALSPDLVLWIDVRPQGPRPEDSTLVAATSENDTAGAPSLSAVLAAIPSNRVILNFRANRPGMIDVATRVIDESKASDRLLIQSPEDGVLREMREVRPLWVYGSSLPRITQLEMLASIALEPAAPLKGDALVIEITRERDALRHDLSKLVNEGHRRKMKVYLGPASGEEVARFRELGVDGILTSDPAPLLNQVAR